METDIRDIKERSCALRKDILSLQKQNKQLTHHVEQLSKQILRFGQKLSATENILREDRGYISSEYFYALSDYTFSGNQTKKKVLICGYYGARNCGDELMLQSILSNLDSEKVDITIFAAPNYQLDATEYLPYHIIHYPRKPGDCAYLASKFDVAIWGGGAVIDDVNYSAYNWGHPTYAFVTTTVAMLKNGKKAYVFGVSTNKELKNAQLIDNLSYIIQNAECFSLRDKNSLVTLKNAGIDTAKIKVIDDLAFALDYPTRESCEKEDSVFTVGMVFPMKDATMENLTSFAAKAYMCLQKEIPQKIRVCLIPFFDRYNHDFLYFDRIVDSIRRVDENALIEKQNIRFYPDSVADALNACDLLITMRYHAALIGSAILGKHVLCINYGDTHPHYYNKIQYIQQTYCHDLVMIDFQSLNDQAKVEKAIDESLKVKNGLGKSELNTIQENIKKYIHAYMDTL